MVEYSDFAEVWNDPLQYGSVQKIAEHYGVSPRTIRSWAATVRDSGVYLIERQGINTKYLIEKADELRENMQEPDPDIVEENVRMAAKLQRERDRNRIQNKSFREHARVLNAVETFNEELITTLKRHKPHNLRTHKVNESAPVGVVHLTDIHFNEQVDLPNNQYNWLMCSARIRAHINAAKRFFKPLGVSEILVAFTGDLLNSDRRLDELLMNATNRSKAVFLGYDILRQALIDLNQDFNVSVASITGNESRVGKDLGFAQPIASESYDTTIFHMLAVNLDSEGIRFNVNDDPSEVVVNVNGHNLLLMHGHAGLSKGNLTSSIAKTRARYMDVGVNVRYVIFGHIHEACVSDWFARGGSPVGSNDYSFKGLGLTGRASQNLHLFYEDGKVDSIKVDLQTAKEDEGYDIDEALFTYNTKSHSKLSQGKVIFEVVI